MSQTLNKENILRLGAGLPSYEDLKHAERQGWLDSSRRAQAGQTYELFNYSRQTQFRRQWNAVTTAARGLVICRETSEIVALPMAKFFNLGEAVGGDLVALPKSGPFEVLVKMDGVCGIGYRLDGRLCWATRGSFNSPQGAVAQAMWDELYRRHEHLFFSQWSHITPVVEIVHPATRIVVRYKFQDLVLIAARDRFTGATIAYEQLVEMAERLEMPVVERIAGADLNAVRQRAAELDDNHEGFVLVWKDGYRLKVKGDEYKRLHRILTGMTPHVVAQAWLEGSTGELLRDIPEEFRQEVEQAWATLDARTAIAVNLTERLWTEGRHDEQAFVQWVKIAPAEMKQALFNRRKLDDRGIGLVLALNAVSQAIEKGDIYGFLQSERYAALASAIRMFEQTVAEMLWSAASCEEQGMQLKSKVCHALPPCLQGSFLTAINMLRPQYAVEKLQEFLHLPEHQERYAAVDAASIFAAAPQPDSPHYQHINWVLSYPGPLRVYLHCWRQAGQKQTAVKRARALLAACVRTLSVLEPAQVLSVPGSAELEAMLLDLCEHVARLWDSIPASMTGEQMLHHCRHDCLEPQWATALLMQAWSHPRQVVFDNYLAEQGKKQSFLPDEDA